MKRPAQAERICRACAHFRNDPGYLEAAIPGWSALGSAWGSTRAEDGICVLRDLYLSATQGCERFQGRGAVTPST